MYHKGFLTIVKPVLELLFPTECLICGRDGAFCCAECQAFLVPRKHERCLYCERIIRRGQPCPKHKRKPVTAIVEAFHYTEAVKRLVHGLKYEGMRPLVPILSQVLIDSVRQSSLPRCLIVPVPLHRKRQNERGFNQAELFATALALAQNWRWEPLLVRNRETKAQVGLGGKERRQNLVGAFQATRRLDKGEKYILLVDDVTTTGSTLSECAKALRAAGARRVYAAVIARG